MRLVTLSPSRPASGLSLTEKVMASVGGSIGWAGRALSTAGSQMVSATVVLVRPAMATMSPASRLVDADALQAAEGQQLGDAARLDHLAVAGQRLDRHVGAGRARLDTAGQDAAEIGVRLPASSPACGSASSLLAATFGGGTWRQDQVEQRLHVVALGFQARPPPSRWRPDANRVGKSSCSSVGFQRGEQVEHLVMHLVRRGRRGGRPC